MMPTGILDMWGYIYRVGNDTPVFTLTEHYLASTEIPVSILN